MTQQAGEARGFTLGPDQVVAGGNAAVAEVRTLEVRLRRRTLTASRRAYTLL